MDVHAIEALLKAGFTDCELELNAEGNKLGLIIVSSDFEGLNRVKRQQLVYSKLNDKIQSGEIHAVSMRTLTPEEK